MSINQYLEWFNSLPVERADELKLEFASSVDRAINAQGLSRKKVAEKVGASSAWITKVLRGDANLTIESMAKLAEAVGYSLHLELKHKAGNPTLSSSEVFIYENEAFRQATFKGAREAEFKFSCDFVVTNESEYADAA